MNIYQKAIEKFGIFNQELKMIEEMAELMKELSKSGNIYNSAAEESQIQASIAEEIADVQIVLEQMKILYPKWKQHEERKLKRLEELIQQDVSLAIKELDRLAMECTLSNRPD